MIILLPLSAPISSLPRLSPAYQKRFLKLGVKTIEDLLYHLPRRYDDFSKITKIGDLRLGQTATVQGKISEINNLKTWRKKMTITEAYIQDDTGIIKAVWFNQPYLTNVLKKDTYNSLSGKVNIDKALYFSNPAYEKLPANYELTNTNYPFRHTGRLIPVYPETAGLSSRYIRYIIQPLLPIAEQMPDWLPETVKASQRLVELKTAIKYIHFPPSLKDANAARRRLAFEELFLLQVFALTQKIKRFEESAGPVAFNAQLIKKFVAELAFNLTDAQKKAAWEIFQDLAKNKPMNRLLEGDVGSGKTVVAAMAALEAASAGYQTAFMAPTEILANQHFKTLTALLAGRDINLCLLTSADAKEFKNNSFSSVSKKKLLRQIENGETRIIVGTQALIQKKVKFQRMILAIVDEQHRFGVAQRAALQNMAGCLKDGLPQTTPHLLSMTATPIPRTLALTAYGDLDLSLLDEMPAGRQKIITSLVPPAKRTAAYEFIRRQIKQGRQVFVVCPRIECSAADIAGALSAGDFCPEIIETQHRQGLSSTPDNVGTGTVKAEYDKLSKKIFPEFRVALLHGKLKPKEKEKIMADFAQGRTDILVSTSVVEVGIDVPNAAIMMIEGAERFGLAQLHQLRGRVGRGQHQSYCLLFTDLPTEQTRQRLQIMTACDDGFRLAEKDLELRGPGQFFGANQSGLPDLPMKSIFDLIMIKQARSEAAKILRQDPTLKKYPLLKEQLKKFRQEIHLE